VPSGTSSILPAHGCVCGLSTKDALGARHDTKKRAAIKRLKRAAVAFFHWSTSTLPFPFNHLLVFFAHSPGRHSHFLAWLRCPPTAIPTYRTTLSFARARLTFSSPPPALSPRPHREAQCSSSYCTRGLRPLSCCSIPSFPMCPRCLPSCTT